MPFQFGVSMEYDFGPAEYMMSSLEQVVRQADSIALFSIFVGMALLILLVIAIRHILKSREFQAAQEKLAMLSKLKQANKDLETFSYFTAHDLKEPMRTISCFSTILAQDQSAQLSDEHRQYLLLMKSSAVRMSKLANDLIDYINKGYRETVELEPVDTKEQLGLVLNDLKVMIDESTAQVTTDHLPVLTAHAPSLRRIMQNLIANAIKYRQPGIAPIIHVRAAKKGDEWVFEVRDNGIGFEMSHAQTIFEPFRRLHHHEDIEGSGMGLSIFKKLLERLGGRIWINSTPGKGTTVYFAIPQ